MIKFPLLLLLSIFLLTDCKKDKKVDNPDATADEITDWLKIDGAVKKSGNLPSPTVGAPVLFNLSPAIGGITDGSFVFNFKASDDFEGIYLKVKGASTYLEIPFSSSDGERLTAGSGSSGAHRDGFAYRDTTGYIIIVVNLDEASNEGEFCFEYCIFDATGNVSNIEEVCVSISNGGGLDELVGKWKLYEYIDYGSEGEYPLYYYYTWGGESLEHYISCGDTTFLSNQYYYWEFFPSGDVHDINKYIYKSGVLCDEAKKEYYNNQKIDLSSGFWVYNSTSNRIDLTIWNRIINQGTPIQQIFNYFGSFPGFGFKVTIDGNNLSLYTEGGGSPFEYLFTRY
jgi:hypothetical protein